MRAVDIIQKKRDNKKLSDKEIEFLLNGYLAGNIPDYQQMISKLSTEKTRFLTSFLKETSLESKDHLSPSVSLH